MTMEELLEQCLNCQVPTVKALAKKVKTNWDQGVAPSSKQINELASMLEDFNSPCTRVMEDGRCNGWLAKYGQECQIPSQPPHFCPFSARENTPSTFPQCPGYRTVERNRT